MQPHFQCEGRTITHLRSGAFDIAHGKQMLTTPGRYRLAFDIKCSAEYNAPVHTTLPRYGICVGVCDAAQWTKNGQEAAFAAAMASTAAARMDPAPGDANFNFSSHGHRAAWMLDLASGSFYSLSDAKRLADTSWSKAGADGFERLCRRSRLEPINSVVIEVDLPEAHDAARHLRTFAPGPHPLAQPPPAPLLSKFSPALPSSKVWSYSRTPEQYMPELARPSGKRRLRFSINDGPFVEPSMTQVHLPETLYPWVALSFANDSVSLRSAERLDPPR
jgi:hypothetical protein